MKKLHLFIMFVLWCGFTSAQRPLITKWDTGVGKFITITTVGDYSFTYKKADNPEISGSGNGVSGLYNFTFPESGVYILEITPTSAFKFVGSTTNSIYLTEIMQWGDITWNSNLSSMFQGYTKLKISAEDVPNFSNVTNMQYMFNKCSSIVLIPNANSWDTSKVTTMGNMFSDATNFNQNIGGWNTGKVMTMSFMFKGTAFNQDIGNWNVASTEDMPGMFQDSPFNQYIGNWDTRALMGISNMFDNNKVFNQDISNWKTGGVFHMQGTFKNATAFNQDIGKWNTQTVITFQSMFSGATSFNQSLEKWTGHPGYGDMSNMFDYSGINCLNYGKTLKGWYENVKVENKKTLGARGLKYGIEGEKYRSLLVSNKQWNIIGDTFDPSCPDQLSTQNVGLNNKITVYPLPTTGILYIHSEEKGKAELYNMNGQFLRRLNLQKGENKIDISNFPKGVYLIKYGTNSAKVIKS